MERERKNLQREAGRIWEMMGREKVGVADGVRAEICVRLTALRLVKRKTQRKTRG